MGVTQVGAAHSCHACLRLAWLLAGGAECWGPSARRAGSGRSHRSSSTHAACRPTLQKRYLLRKVERDIRYVILVVSGALGAVSAPCDFLVPALAGCSAASRHAPLARLTHCSSSTCGTTPASACPACYQRCAPMRASRWVVRGLLPCLAVPAFGPFALPPAALMPPLRHQPLPAMLQVFLDWLSSPTGVAELAPDFPQQGLLQRVQAAIAATATDAQVSSLSWASSAASKR